MGVVLTKPVDINIYVAAENGDELNFCADIDDSGDVIITLEQEILDEYLRDLLGDPLTLYHFLKDCCDDGLERAVVAITKELQSRGVPMNDLYSLIETTKCTDSDMDIAVGNVYTLNGDYLIVAYEGATNVPYRYKVWSYNPVTKKTSFGWFTSKGDDLAYCNQFNTIRLRNAELIDTGVILKDISLFIEYVNDLVDSKS